MSPWLVFLAGLLVGWLVLPMLMAALPIPALSGLSGKPKAVGG